MRFEYCTTGSGACITPTGLSTTGAAVDASSDDQWEGFSTLDASSNGTIDLSDGTGTTVTSSVTTTIAFSGITNPSASGEIPTTFYVRITTYTDVLTTVSDGPSHVAATVVPKVTISGTQDAILELTVTATSTGETIGDASEPGKATTGTSTATTLAFGSFAPIGAGGAESKAVAHIIKVGTNGSKGYSASVQGASAAMARSGGVETISYVGSDIDWVEASTAGFGVNAQDVESDSGSEANTTEFGTVGGVLEYEDISSAVELASAGGPTVGVETMVVFRVQVQSSQAAGEYSGNVNYTVLPNF